MAKNFKLENATELIDCVSPALIFSSLLLSSETANKVRITASSKVYFVSSNIDSKEINTTA